MTERLQYLIDHFAGGKNTRFAALIGTNEARIRSYLSGSAMPKLDFLEALVYYLDVSINWFVSGQGPMLLSEVKEQEGKGTPSILSEALPVYEVDFTCGFDEIENEQNAQPSYYMDTPLNRSADLWCTVQGKSMMPDIEPGDKVALRRITWDSFEPGYIYAVVMDDLRTVKTLRRVPGQPEQLDFVATNPDYGVERYPIGRIRQLYRVVGKLHSF